LKTAEGTTSPFASGFPYEITSEISDVNEIQINLKTARAIAPIGGSSRPVTVKQNGVPITNFGLARSGGQGDLNLVIYATGTSPDNLTLSYAHNPSFPIAESESPFNVLPSFTDVVVPYYE